MAKHQRNKSTRYINHDADYWARLRRDFRRCNFEFNRAYESVNPVRRSAEIATWRKHIETREQLVGELMDKQDDETLIAMMDVRQRINGAIKEHWKQVAGLGCIITGKPAEIAHCHGGSISLELEPRYRPGMAQRQNHWLVIPLNPQLHRGQFGLDTSSVREWERAYGDQVTFLEEVSWRLGYDVFAKAGIEDYEYRAFDRPPR